MVPYAGIFHNIRFVYQLQKDIKDRYSKQNKTPDYSISFFSIILGTIARNGNIIKQVLGTLIAGNANITEYTFQFYFLNVLFVAYIVLRCLYSLQLKGIATASLVTGLYIVTHLIAYFVPDSILGWIPWNIDIAICATVYLYIGKRFNSSFIHNLGGVFMFNNCSYNDNRKQFWSFKLSI